MSNLTVDALLACTAKQIDQHMSNTPILVQVRDAFDAKHWAALSKLWKGLTIGTRDNRIGFRYCLQRLMRNDATHVDLDNWQLVVPRRYFVQPFIKDCMDGMFLRGDVDKWLVLTKMSSSKVSAAKVLQFAIYRDRPDIIVKEKCDAGHISSMYAIVDDAVDHDAVRVIAWAEEKWPASRITSTVKNRLTRAVRKGKCKILKWFASKVEAPNSKLRWPVAIRTTYHDVVQYPKMIHFLYEECKYPYAVGRDVLGALIKCAMEDRPGSVQTGDALTYLISTNRVDPACRTIRLEDHWYPICSTLEAYGFYKYFDVAARVSFHNQFKNNVDEVAEQLSNLLLKDLTPIIMGYCGTDIEKMRPPGPMHPGVKRSPHADESDFLTSSDSDSDTEEATARIGDPPRGITDDDLMDA